MKRLDAGASPSHVVDEITGELNFDLVTAIETLANALLLITLTIDVYKRLRVLLKRDPTDDEVRKAVHEERPELTKYIANWLQKVADIMKLLRP
jgi:hypothetical protein